MVCWSIFDIRYLAEAPAIVSYEFGINLNQIL